jgi:hypothetical protein
MGFAGDELICLNRVRCHQQVTFYLDIFDAGGKVLDQKYRCGARLGGAQSNVFNPSLGLFLYHILHTMSL